MKEELKAIPEEDRRKINEKFQQKLRGSMLRGVYAVTNLPPELQEAAGRARAISADNGLGATHPSKEPELIASGLRSLRKEVKEIGITLPFFPEIGDVE